MDFWSKLGFALAIFGIGISVVAFFVPFLWREIPRWGATVGFAAGIVLCVAAVACFKFIPDPVEPEVTLRFVYKQSPNLQLLNISDATASNVKWEVGAIDIDAPPDRILPIPATTFDFLTARNNSLPINLFAPPAATASIVKAGDRIIGTAGVDCPACRRGHTFVFFITLGRGGWISELKDVTNGNVILPANVNGTNEFRESIERTPEADRIAIVNLPGTE